MRIALWGNFGTQNLGNECTLAATILHLRNRMPDAELIAICSEPRDTAARHGLAAIAITAARGSERSSVGPRALRALRLAGRECMAWLRAIRRGTALDALIVVGTGILTDTGEGTLGFPYELLKWSLATKLWRGKVVFLSVGVEAIRSPLARAFIFRSLRLADYRSYRDKRAAALLESAGFPLRGDIICPDLAFGLPPPGPASRMAGRTVAVGLFNYHDRGAGSLEAAAAYDRYLERICSLIEWLLGEGYAVRVIIGDLAYDEPVRLDLRARLQSRGLPLAGGAFADEPAASYEQLLEQIAKVDAVIASRYHNVLLALLSGIPTVSLSYEGKNEELMREMGLGEFCQTLDSFDVPRLIGQFRALQARAQEIRRELSARTDAARSLLATQYEQIVNCITGPA